MRGGQSVLPLHHNNSAKMSERLARLLRIVHYSPEKIKTAVQILACSKTICSVAVVVLQAAWRTKK
jgi:hypothetical protein